MTLKTPLLARFVEPFVLAAWKQFRNGVLDQALLHAGTTTKAPTMARLEAAHAWAAERLDTARRKLVTAKAAKGRGGAASGASVPAAVAPDAAGAPLVAQADGGAIVIEDDSDVPVPGGAGQKRKRPASADFRRTLRSHRCHWHKTVPCQLSRSYQLEPVRTTRQRIT